MSEPGETAPRDSVGPGRIVVMSGPSGAGKTSVCRELKREDLVEFSVSATTRSKREGEVDGVDYHFLGVEDFLARVDAGEFIEHACYSGNHYGTLWAPLRAACAAGRIFVLEIEVQGTRQLRDAGLDATYVFIAPPSLDEIRRRLVARGTDSRAEIDQRLAIAAREMEARTLYDHVVVNDDLERTIDEVRGLIGLSERVDG